VSKKIGLEIGIGILVLMTLTLGFLFWKMGNFDASFGSVNYLPKNQQKACTMEAKLCPDGSSVGRSGPNCEFAACPEIVGIADKIIISSPAPEAAVSSSVSVSGKAVGTWFFEGSFPAEMHDSNNKLLGTGIMSFTPKSETDTWMTEEFVDFRGEIKFSNPATESGYILFKKDNPSDQRELDESFKLPVKFTNGISDWKTYRNDEYGFEIKYPKDWPMPLVDKQSKPAEGVLYLEDVKFKNGNSPEKIGFSISISKNSTFLDYDLLDQGIGLALQSSFKGDLNNCPKPSEHTSIGDVNYPAKIIYVAPQNPCFQETYFYILKNGNYNYVISPEPLKGEGYIGYDGKKETQKSFPSFYQILSTFKFTK
jgi:hypothetical protein